MDGQSDPVPGPLIFIIKKLGNYLAEYVQNCPNNYTLKS